MKRVKIKRKDLTYTLVFTNKTTLDVSHSKVVELLMTGKLLTKELRLIKNNVTGYETFWFNHQPITCNKQSSEYKKMKAHMNLADKVLKMSKSKFKIID